MVALRLVPGLNLPAKRVAAYCRRVKGDGKVGLGVGMSKQPPTTEKILFSAAIMAGLAIWQIYTMATATEAPSTGLKVLQYVLLGGLALGLINSAIMLSRKKN
jgi:hypothetical protein